MRLIPALATLLLLSACGFSDDHEKAHPVDPSALGPLTGREQALLVGADGAYRGGNYEAAERDYQSAVAASTGHIEAHMALAKLYDKTNQPKKERAILERALEYQPENGMALYQLGKLDLAVNKNDEALARFNRGLQSTPNDFDLLNAAAIANDMLGNHAAAQTLYQRAINLHQGADLSAARTNLGMSYLLSNEPKKAVTVLRDEVKRPGTSAVTRHNLALAYGMLGKNTEAKALLHGEMDEENRQLALGRLKEYINDRRNDPLKKPRVPSPIQPAITTQK